MIRSVVSVGLAAGAEIEAECMGCEKGREDEVRNDCVCPTAVAECDKIDVCSIRCTVFVRAAAEMILVRCLKPGRRHTNSQ